MVLARAVGVCLVSADLFFNALPPEIYYWKLNIVDSKTAEKCRSNLIKIGLNTKILPEAMTWHFAKYWSHMKELSDSHKGKLKISFPKSERLLKKCVSIPINCKMKKNIPLNIKNSLTKTLKLNY